MAAALIHRCENCGFETGIEASLEVFEQNPHCIRCGLSATEGDLKMQEELATLTTQHLNLQNSVNFEAEPHSPPIPQQQDLEAPITYITQHYHHSAHQAAQILAPETTSLAEMLASHGVNATVLSPSQINLFEQVQPEQQARLIQLWSIAPPNGEYQPLTENMMNTPQISVQQEEEAARVRYLNRQADLDKNSGSPEQKSAEPYILRGYETHDPSDDVSTTEADSTSQSTDYNRALDPAYQSREWRLHESRSIEHHHQHGIAPQQVEQFADCDHDMS